MGLNAKLKLADKVKSYPFGSHLLKYRKPYLWGVFWLFLVDLINVAQPLIVKWVIDDLAAGRHSRIWSFSGLYGMTFFLQAVGRYWWRYFLLGTSYQISADLRNHLYRHLQRLPLASYQKIRTGDLMSRATSDIDAVRMAHGPGILVALDAIMLFSLLVPAMFYLSWKLALLSLVVHPLVPFITAKFGKRIDAVFEKVQERLAALSSFTQENFSGIRLLKSLVLEKTVADRFEELGVSAVTESKKLARVEAGFSPLLALITQLGTLSILIWGGKEVLAGALTVGTFVAFQRFVVQLSWPLEAMGWSVTLVREAKAAERRIEEYLHLAPVQDRLLYSAASRQTTKVLDVEALRFAYPGNDSFHFELEQFSVSPAEHVGLVGTVGAGKSTLFSLLLRLYEPPPHTVFFQGKDVLSLSLKELRSRVASVEQQVFLFSETIHENLLLGVNRTVSDLEIQKAMETAGIWNEVQRFELKLQTKLGERGLNLSGGQKSRLALARALLRQPDLLILDDSFSAVDVQTEHGIIERLLSEYRGLAVIVASHRLSIMPRIDKVLLLDQGKKVGEGTHYELMDRSPLYRELYSKSEVKEDMEKRVGEVPIAPSVAFQVEP